MSINKPKVLVMADWFDPGFKAGGPIRSCVNFAGNLKDHLDIHVLTTDRDLGDHAPYPGIQQDTWIRHSLGINVFYASPQWISWKNILEAIRSVRPDVIYLNSMYSRYFSLYPLLMKKRGAINSKVVLSPRGMLKDSAIQFKAGKKKLFLRLFRLLGLQRGIVFHATDATEQQDIKKYFGTVQSVLIGNNHGLQHALKLPVSKAVGEVDLLFIGRLHPIKNLHYLLELLRTVRRTVRFTIVAGMENKEYWDQCQEIIQSLPENIRVHYAGELPHPGLETVMNAHHLFVLPTKGENFGHAIFEALAAGRPVLVSDQTPWRRLAQYKAGWDLPLDRPQDFAAVIEAVADMDQPTLHEWCHGAWNFCKAYLDNAGIKEQYIKLFS